MQSAAGLLQTPSKRTTVSSKLVGGVGVWGAPPPAEPPVHVDTELKATVKKHTQPKQRPSSLLLCSFFSTKHSVDQNAQEATSCMHHMHT